MKIGFFGLLLIVFITLKLCHLINWPWWCVLMPLWISLLIFILSMAFLIVVTCANQKQNRLR